MVAIQKTALISVYRKEGIVDFAQKLVDRDWNILSSSGTFKHLQDSHVPVIDVAYIVGEPILGHRVVTLSREIHAGLLADQSDEHQAELDRLGIPRIDLVCVDLYPLEDAIAKPDKTFESVIACTDIGGPTLLRSAAKGGRLVICDPTDRPLVIQWIDSGASDLAFVRSLCAKAEFTVAKYCTASANFLSDGVYQGKFTIDTRLSV